MRRLFLFSSAEKPTLSRSFSCRWSATLVLASVLTATSTRAAPVLTEEAGTRQVCSVGPDAELARAMRRRGAAAVTAAGVLPNPSFSVQHQRTLAGAEERETIVGLSVPLGVSGRRGLVQQAAAARHEGASADAEATLFESALAFREAYLTALMDEARAKISSEQQVALEASTAIIEALAKSGEAAEYDLLRQRLQARIHRGALDAARARARASRINLQIWIQAEVELPEIDIAALANASAASPPAEPRRWTPGVHSLRAASNAHALEADAARRRWVPDPEVFAGYRAVEGTGDTARGLSLSLSVPLTFFDHGQGEAAQAEAERSVADAAAAQLAQRQRVEALSARARLELLVSGVADLEQARGEAQALLAQAQRLYAAGETSITEMLEAFRAVEEARLAELERVSEIALTRLLVMRASGTLFDASLDRACRRPEPTKP